jgi:hypothetical protein
MAEIRERLELYLPTDVSNQDHLRGVVIGAASRYLPEIVGGTTNGDEILRETESSALRLEKSAANAIMVTALRDVREETAKTRLLRITSVRENGLSFTKSRIDSNRSKKRGKRQRRAWGQEGASEYLSEVYDVTEITFASAALERALDSRPTQRKKLLLRPDEDSLAGIRDFQDTLIEGVQPTMRRGIEINRRSYDDPVCEIADIDTSNARDTHIRQFLDEVHEALPVTLSVGRLVVRYDSFGDSKP